MKRLSIIFLMFCLGMSGFAQNNGNWVSLGPTQVPQLGGDGFAHATAGIGMVSCVRFDPRYDGKNNRTVYAGGTNGGVWKSVGGGNDWVVLNTDQLPNISVSDIAVNPKDPNTIFVCSGFRDNGFLTTNKMGKKNTHCSGIYKTTDGGKTWQAGPTGIGNWYSNKSLAPELLEAGFWNFPSNKLITRMIICPMNPNVMMVSIIHHNPNDKTQKGYVYKSKDGGNNWYKVFEKAGENFYDMEFKVKQSGIIYLSGFGVYRSENTGDTWKEIHTNGLPDPASLHRTEIAVTANDPEFLYVLCTEKSSFFSVYLSENGGNTFTLKSRPAFAGRNCGWCSQDAVHRIGFDASPVDKNLVAYGSLEAHVSHDRGGVFTRHTNWGNRSVPEYVHADVHSMRIAPVTGEIYIGCDGGVSKSADGGQTWQDISKGLGVAEMNGFGVSTSNPNLIQAGMQDVGTVVYDPENYGTENPWKIIYGGDGFQSMIDHQHDSIWFVFGNFVPNLSTYNGGKSWRGFGVNQNGHMVQNPVNSQTMFQLTRTQIWKSPDRGLNFPNQPLIDFRNMAVSPADQLSAIALSEADTNIIYAGFSGPTWNSGVYDRILFKSTDGGRSWIDINPSSSDRPRLEAVQWATLTDIVVSPTNPDKVWVTFGEDWDGMKVFFSDDGGLSWSNYSEGIPRDCPVYKIAYKKGSTDELYIGTDKGVFYRQPEMKNWVNFSNGLPRVRVTDINIHEGAGKIRAATYGRGLWESDLAR